jgi:hypothetical protein
VKGTPMFKKILQYFNLAKPSPFENKPNSMYILMPNGPMRKSSIGRVIVHELLHAYHLGTSDDVDQETLLSAMRANLENEQEQAWQAFLSEIGYEED